MDLNSSLLIAQILIGIFVCQPLHELLHWLPARLFGYRAKIHLKVIGTPYVDVGLPTEDSSTRNLMIAVAPALVWVPIGYVLWTLGLIFGFLLVVYNLCALILESYKPEGDLRRIIRGIRSRASGKQVTE
jgi:hypothetical protein